MPSPSTNSRAGFVIPTPQLKKRVIWSIEGPGKSGKTDLACAAPGDILYLPFDINYKDTVDKARARGKKIYEPEGGMYRRIFAQGIAPKEVGDVAKENYQRFLKDLHKGFKSGFRTIVIDTATEVWQTFVEMRYGKTSQIPMHLWGPLYFEFGNDLKMALDVKEGRDTNLLLLHQLKDEYVDSGQKDEKGNNKQKKSGAQVLDGCKKMEYFVQAFLRTRFDEETNQFFASFRVCTQNMKLCGQEFEIPDDGTGFQMLAMEAMPNVDPEMWEDS